MVLVSSFPVWRKELLVLVTGFCWYFFIICACVWVKICQGKVQQEKSTDFCSEANETMNSYCSCKCNLDWAALKVVTSLAVSVKTGCCRKAWTRENGSSTLTKNNPRKTRFFWTGTFSSVSGKRIVMGSWVLQGSASVICASSCTDL